MRAIETKLENCDAIPIQYLFVIESDFDCSGAEDHHAYVWDRYYGICLAKYQHTDVVNSVAFNPRDSEMLVTTSDDYTIKVMRQYKTKIS